MKEIESIINFSKTEMKGPEGSLINYIKYFKKKLHQCSSNLYQKIEVEGILPNFFSEARITLLRGPDKFYIYYWVPSTCAGDLRGLLMVAEKPGKLEVGGASRDSTGFGALEEGLMSS